MDGTRMLAFRSHHMEAPKSEHDVSVFICNRLDRNAEHLAIGVWEGPSRQLAPIATRHHTDLLPPVLGQPCITGNDHRR